MCIYIGMYCSIVVYYVLLVLFSAQAPRCLTIGATSNPSPGDLKLFSSFYLEKRFVGSEARIFEGARVSILIFCLNVVDKLSRHVNVFL